MFLSIKEHHCLKEPTKFVNKDELFLNLLGNYLYHLHPRCFKQKENDQVTDKKYPNQFVRESKKMKMQKGAGPFEISDSPNGVWLGKR